MTTQKERSWSDLLFRSREGNRLPRRWLLVKPFISNRDTLRPTGQDAYGMEAVQVLLKRIEDDRQRLIVVLAGYPAPMRELLHANPGLSSRFQRTFTFPDYSATELLQIVRRMCRQNHYRLTEPAKQKLLDAFRLAILQKDQHFGNGRLARNVFEKAIRRQASRLVNVAPITRRLLATLEPADIEFANVPEK